jgi:hypothetical protein
MEVFYFFTLHVSETKVTHTHTISLRKFTLDVGDSSVES